MLDLQLLPEREDFFASFLVHLRRPEVVVAVLTKVAQGQQELISSQQKAFDEQKDIIAELTEKIKDLEER